MAGENLKEPADKTMSALRERLRQTRESLNKTGPEPGRKNGRAAAPKTPSLESPFSEKPDTVRAPLRPMPERAPFSTESLARKLRRQSSKLGAIVSGTEDEFLRIGERLHDFHHRAHKIAEMSEYIARLINDEDVEKTICELNWILDSLNTWFSGLPADEGISNRRRRAEKVVERTESCLATLTEKHNRSMALARTFADKSDNVTRYIGEVIRSLQFHDITRQRIEYVMAELDSLMGLIDPAPGKPLEKELAAASGDRCRELARVLTAAGREFGDAALSITGNLEMVASNASAISEEIRATTKGEGDSEKSFLSGMGNWLSALADTIEGFSRETGAHGEVHPRLCQRGGSASGKEDDEGRTEFSRLVDVLNGMVKSMHRINGNILYHLTLIDDSGKSLSEDIGEEIGMFVVHERLTSVLEDAAKDIESIAEKCRPAGTRPPGGNDKAQIRASDTRGEEVGFF